MYFTNLQNDGLTIYPTHRIIRSTPRFSPQRFLKKVLEVFEVEPLKTVEELLDIIGQKSRQVRLGMMINGDSGHYLLTVRDQLRAGGEGVPAVLAGLDVMILQSNIMKNILHMTEEDIQNKKYIEYTQDPVGAIREVRDGKADAAFLLHPPRVEQVKAVAEACLVMPPKSTYFYPKLLSGLVMYSFAQE